MSNKRDHKAFTDALEQFATQYGYKVTNIGLSRPPMEFVGGSATDSLTRLNVLPVSLEVSFRDMMDSEEVTEDSEKTVLPDWCKVGEWCYCLDDDGNPKYFKITRIEDGFIYGEDWDIDYHFVRQARLRPYNAEEMRGLVGKIVQFGEFYNLVIMYDGRNNEILVGDGDWLSESSLLNDYTIDGSSPCGVLEHLNDNGEWVE